MTYYLKALMPKRRCMFVNWVWPEPGEWADIGTTRPIGRCSWGLHFTDTNGFLSTWAGPCLWIIEVDDTQTVQFGEDKGVCRRARLVSEVTATTDQHIDMMAALLLSAQTADIFNDQPAQFLQKGNYYLGGDFTIGDIEDALPDNPQRLRLIADQLQPSNQPQSTIGTGFEDVAHVASWIRDKLFRHALDTYDAAAASQVSLFNNIYQIPKEAQTCLSKQQ